MESPVAFLLVPFIVVLLLHIGSSAFKVLKIKKATPKLPPGPPKLPIIGNLHQLLGSSPTRALYKLAREYGPFMHVQLGEISAVVVSSSRGAKEFLKNDINFAQRSVTLAAKTLFYDAKDLIFSPYGEYWRQMRKLCTMELLSQKRVQSFSLIRQEEVNNLIKKISLSDGSLLNVSDMIFSLTYHIVSRAAFGERYRDQEKFLSLIEEGQRPSSGFNLADVYPSIPILRVITGLKRKLNNIHSESDRLLENIINDHNNKTEGKTDNVEGHEGLIQILQNIQRSNALGFPLSDMCLKGVILDVFTAGTETSSSCIEWAITELMKNPGIMMQAQAEVRQVFKEKGTVEETGIRELKYLKAIIKETLRLHPPVTLLQRECLSSCEIIGYHIPVKTYIILNLWAFGRDPDSWSEPEKFCPERFLDSSVSYTGSDFEYIPFGSGRRMCPGILFAMADIELPLAQLLYHFDWKLPNGMKPEDLDVDEEFGLSTRRKNKLFLIPIPYRSV